MLSSGRPSKLECSFLCRDLIKVILSVKLKIASHSIPPLPLYVHSLLSLSNFTLYSTISLHLLTIFFRTHSDSTSSLSLSLQILSLLSLASQFTSSPLSNSTLSLFFSLQFLTPACHSSTTF